MTARTTKNSQGNKGSRGTTDTSSSSNQTKKPYQPSSSSSSSRPHLLPATPLVDLHPFSALLFLTKRKNVAETMAFVDTAVQRVTLQTPVLTKKPPPTINQISFSPAYPTPSQQL